MVDLFCTIGQHLEHLIQSRTAIKLLNWIMPNKEIILIGLQSHDLLLVDGSPSVIGVIRLCTQEISI